MPKSYIRRSDGIWAYNYLLPPVSQQHRVTLGEGHTPLVRSLRIGPSLGLQQLYFKLESLNPTGSYKDRIAACGVSCALDRNRTAVVGTSSGNAGVSIAAYAARAGLPYIVYVQEHITQAKLEQLLIYGATVRKVAGFGVEGSVGDRVFQHVKNEAGINNWELLITATQYAPEAMRAVQSIVYELYDGMEGLPDAIYIPVGGGGLYTGIHHGLNRLCADTGGSMPKLVAVQPVGCDTVVGAWAAKADRPLPGDSSTQVSGLQVPNAPDGACVIAGIRNTDAWGERVPDESTWSWQQRLAEDEGVFCEPASAITVAGVAQSVASGRLHPDAKVVCCITGAGYKDEQQVKRLAQLHSVTELSVDQLDFAT